MNEKSSPYVRPWNWFFRQVAVIGSIVLSGWLVSLADVSGSFRGLIQAALISIAVVLGLRLLVDILTAGICKWMREMGGGLGALTVAIRRSKRIE